MRIPGWTRRPTASVVRPYVVSVAVAIAAAAPAAPWRAIPAAAFDLPNTAGAACSADGNRLVLLLETPPPGQVVRFPRLDAVVFEVSWEPEDSARATADESAAPPDGPYPAPRLTPPTRLLDMTQSPEMWTIHLGDEIRYPARITLQLESPPLPTPRGRHCAAGADGVIVLPARHALPQGATLQFEPLCGKNTVGCWVEASDSVEWSFATDTAGRWDVHVLQGCGAGQGGSRVRFACGSASLEHVVVDTGHFQNFRWKRVGEVDLPRSDRLTLTVSCLEKAHKAVMDIRQIRLVPQGPRPRVTSIGQTQPDVVMPPLTARSPAAGRRVILTLPGRDADDCYHALSLPTDWRAGGRYPVLAEWAGNGHFASPEGDRNSGRVEDACLAYGLAGNDGAIVIGLPFLDGTGTRNVTRWWGTAPSHDPAPTLAYAKRAIADVCDRFGGDPARVALVGFSRGSIACNALGLADDEMATVWQAAVCFSHYDGLQRWPFPGSDALSAVGRLARMGGRRQLIIAESVPEMAGGQPPPALVAIRRHLETARADGEFTFLETGFRNHDDDWALRPSPARREARRWLSDVFALGPRDESL